MNKSGYPVMTFEMDKDVEPYRTKDGEKLMRMKGVDGKPIRMRESLAPRGVYDEYGLPRRKNSLINFFVRNASWGSKCEFISDKSGPLEKVMNWYC